MRVGIAAAAMAAAVEAFLAARRRSGGSPGADRGRTDAGCADGGRPGADGADGDESDVDGDGSVVGCGLLMCMLYFLDFRVLVSSGQIG